MAVFGGLTVALLATGVDNQAAAESELEGIGSIRYCETGEALLKLVAAEPIDVVVLQLRDRYNLSSIPTITTLQATSPRIPIIAYLTPRPATLQEAPAALAAGAAECSVRGFDRLATIVRRVLAPEWQPSAALALLEVLYPLVPPDLGEFATACALKASPRLTSRTVASWVRVRERTLRDRLQRASLCAPSVFIDYSAAVHAACMLDLHGLEPDAVVRIMRFGSTRALNNLLKQFVGKSARELREHNGFPVLLLQADSLLRRQSLADLFAVGMEAGMFDRYLADDLSSDERVNFEQWLVGAPPAVVELMEQMRLLLGPRPDRAVLQQRKREMWAKLRRALGRRHGA